MRVRCHEGREKVPPAVEVSEAPALLLAWTESDCDPMEEREGEGLEVAKADLVGLLARREQEGDTLGLEVREWEWLAVALEGDRMLVREGDRCAVGECGCEKDGRKL